MAGGDEEDGSVDARVEAGLQLKGFAVPEQKASSQWGDGDSKTQANPSV